MSLASALAGALLVAAAIALTRKDPAAALASTLGLPSGIVLGALLGGCLGLWLALGGQKRIARTAGVFLGIAFLYAAWRLAEPFLWIVDVVLREVLGDGGEQYAGLVLFLIAIPLFRAAANAGTGLVATMLKQPPVSST